MTALPLLCLLAVSAFGTEMFYGKPHTGDVWEELEARQKQYADFARGFEENLKAMRAIRESFDASSEQGVLLARWEALVKACQDGLRMENGLRNEHRSGLNVVKLEIIARNVPVNGKAQTEAPKEAMAKMILHERRASEMRSEGQRLAKALMAEMGAFEGQANAYRRRWKIDVGWLLGGALALAVVLTVALRGRNSAPLPTTPAVPPAALTHRTVPHANIELGELLGRGAMGEVYAGRDKTLDRRVAVKRLRPELAGNPAELEKLFAQARLMAGLKHPNIIQVHSVERDGNEAFLVLELAEGRTLSDSLAKDGPLPWEDARRMSRAVAEGLDYAHVRGITHGDLKPSNIMIAPDGRVKVMDFALAYAAKATVSRLTRSDAFGGLPYMSPEQELGDPGPGADAYALAACFYEALTGKRPFPGPDFLAQKRAGKFAAPSTLAKRLPPGADSLFKIAFNPNPDLRFHGPAGLAAAADVL